MIQLKICPLSYSLITAFTDRAKRDAVDIVKSNFHGLRPSYQKSSGVAFPGILMPTRKSNKSVVYAGNERRTLRDIYYSTHIGLTLYFVRGFFFHIRYNEIAEDQNVVIFIFHYSFLQPKSRRFDFQQNQSVVVRFEAHRSSNFTSLGLIFFTRHFFFV